MAAVIDLNAARPGATPEDWQHFDLVLGLTADLLPVVSNPRATISPNSKMAALGKTPSRYNGQRQAVGFPDWTQHQAAPAEIAAWARERDYGICLQTRRVRALDVDVTDPELATQIQAFLIQRAGFLPLRSRSNAAKFLVAFELPGELFKRRIRCASGMVEFLAQGQQFVAVGLHPSGVRYEWAGGLPDAFPGLSLEQFEALWRELAEAFGAEAPTESAGSVKAQKLADAAAADPVAQFLLEAGRVKRTERDGRLHIFCPFESEHTADSGDTSTTYWPAHTGGYVNGHFRCLHAHCEHRADQDFLDAIGYAPADEFQAIVDDADGPTPIAETVAVPKEAPAAKPAGKFQLLSAAEFVQGKPQSWLIKGVLPKATVGMLFGEPSAGKSFVALDMAFDLATGGQWRGLKTKKCRVVYVVAEGASGFKKRVRAICKQRGVAPEALPIQFVQDAPNLLEKSDALDLSRVIAGGVGADLVIVDTLAQVTPGANENSGEDMGRAMNHCKGISRATGAMVLLIHHTGKDASKGARGWSGLKGAVDVELMVVDASGRRSVSVTKNKDGPAGMEYQFRLGNVMLGFDEDGEEEASCVVEHVGEPVQRTTAATPKGAVERLVLSTLEDLSGVGNAFVEHGQLKEATRAQIPHDPAAGRDRRGERIERAIESLIANGFLHISGTTLCLKQ